MAPIDEKLARGDLPGLIGPRPVAREIVLQEPPLPRPVIAVEDSPQIAQEPRIRQAILIGAVEFGADFIDQGLDLATGSPPWAHAGAPLAAAAKANASAAMRNAAIDRSSVMGLTLSTRPNIP